ncbi:MAG: glycosyltransferase [Ignavibacteria bacterium]|nr:glycosyltransferase [Ignavibacteria bacterium]
MNPIIKRVLWISDYFPRPHNMTLGVWALESIYAIQRKGIEVAVLSPTPWIPKLFAFTNNLKNWHKVPFKVDIDSVNIFYPKCPHYPHRTVTKYLYNPIPYFESSFLFEWIKPAIKLIAEKYPFQAVHTNFVFPSGYIGYTIKKKYKIPFIVHERSVNRLLNANSHRLRKKSYAKIVNEADAIITPNRKMADIIEKFLHNGKKVNIIRDPGNSASIKNISFFIQAKPERYKNQRIILSVGSLIERKGHEFLVKAINLLKDEFQNIKCLIIGSGVRKNFLENLIKRLQLNQYVELLGQLPHNEVLRTMSWCDIFVLPSWNEAGGTVYGEAMTFGKPIVACKDEGIGEIVEDRVHGLLVNKKDEQSLAEAIKKLLRDEEFAAAIGRASKILAENEFNYDFAADKIIELYNKI